ncbi:tyrosine-type recombinase/integrase [Xenorhabdus sp. DI]|uniref:phage integrase n=1 Tax=Xenorhabdus doucetiae TaxID=351671 RepID=UPI0019AF2A3E|nr:MULTISPECIES: tyrosine-type recombinase/integrase [unclassified Xenorhabdus]MBD2785667.1 tyrosine-type recombinase/integrase [Xenorhabdus sp. 3]MBD2790386.1 tyrosine-type recombinase/integrase [Xenorhabdus sp. DI]
MAITALEGGRYKVDVRPQGRSGRRVQRIFTKKADAVAFERNILANANTQDWKPNTKDFRKLSEILEIWWNYEGRNLTWGKKRKYSLQGMVRDMGDPAMYQLTPRFLAEYRSQRLYDGIKASSINRDMAMLSGIFTVLIDIKEYTGTHPIKSVKSLKIKNPEMSYLTEPDIARLLNAVTGDAWRLTVLCLNTGARWGEASKLRAENMLHNRVTFTETKNGKHRTIPISDEVMRVVKTKTTGPLFNVNYNSYAYILKKVKSDLPRGQAVHVLRHTFAAHFMMNGGNILTLQKILGHASIQQTMAYAHFSPDYLQDAIKFNPLKGSIHIPSTFVDEKEVS